MSLRDQLLEDAKEFIENNPAEDMADEQVSPADGQAPLEGASEPQAESSEPSEVVAQPEASEEQPPLEAPQHWDTASKEAFKALPRQAQDFVLGRVKSMEADHTRKTQEVAEQRKAVEPLLVATKQHEPYLRSIGVSADEAFSTLIGAERMLRTGTPDVKASTIVKLISDYGIDVSQINAALQAPRPQPQNNNLHADPALLNELQELRQQVQGMTSSQLEAQVKSFAESKAPDGTPLYPHFEDVRADMGRLLAAYPDLSLPELYQRATRLSETVQQKIEAQKANEAAEKARLAAANARKSNSINIKPASQSHGDAKPVASLRDSIREIATSM